MKRGLFLLFYVLWKGLAIRGIPSSYARYLMSYNHFGVKLLFVLLGSLLFRNYLVESYQKINKIALIKIGLIVPTSTIFTIGLINILLFRDLNALIFVYPSDQRTLPFVFDALLLAPVFEEMLYRYSLIYVGEKRWLRIITAVGSLLLFTESHIVNVNGNLFALFPYFVIGFYLTITYLRRGNIWESIFAHSFYNFVVMAAAILI